MTIETGGDEGQITKFQVHQSVLCSSSGWLKARCKPEWFKDAAVVNLSHIDTEAFKLYINWLYTSAIMMQHFTDGKKSPSISKSGWRLLAIAYNLGEFKA